MSANIIQMVLLVSSFRKKHLFEMVLLVSSSHMRRSYGTAFSFFPHKGKTCKYVYCVFFHEVNFLHDEAINVFICQKMYSSNALFLHKEKYSSNGTSSILFHFFIKEKSQQLVSSSILVNIIQVIM